MKRLVGYTRVSTVKQGEHGSSLQEQKAAIEAYARRYDLEIAQWFEERETAAKRGRPVFDRMLRALTRGMADGVVIHKIDRSARNLRDWADLGELHDRGIEVHFAHESLDLNSRGGRLSADIQAVVAADFIRNLRDEVRKGIRGRLRQGLFPWAAPIGYQDRGRAQLKVPDPITAPLVRRAFELYDLGGFTLETLCDELNGLGLRSRFAAKRISINGVSTLLKNEFYIGIIFIKKTGERYPGKHEPIVSKQLFDRVQARLEGRIRNTGLRHDFLYRRTLRCAGCGYSIIPERQKGSAYYRCHSAVCVGTSIREEDIDRQAKAALSLVKIHPDEYADVSTDLARRLGKSGESREQLLASIKLSLGQLDERRSKLTDALIDGLIDRSLFEQRNQRLLHERAALLERIDHIGSGGFEAELKGFLELMEALIDNDNLRSAVETRELLLKVTSNLQLDRKKLVVTWKTPFQVLAACQDLPDGEPHRGGHRTFRTKSRPVRHHHTKSRKRGKPKELRVSPLAQKIVDAIKAGLPSTTTSPRPHLHPPFAFGRSGTAREGSDASSPSLQ